MPRRGMQPSRNGDGWRVRWRVPGETKQQSVTWESYPQARALCVEVERAGYIVRADDPQVLDRSIVTGVTGTPPPAGVRTFRTAAEAYISTRGKANDRTRDRYRGYLDRHCVMLADLPVDELDEELSAEWSHALYEGTTNTCRNPHPPMKPPKHCRCRTPLANKTVYGIYHFARGVLTREQRLGHIASHPFAHDQSLRKAARGGGRERFIEIATWHELREFFDGTARDFVDTLAATGCRWGEIAALRAGDLVSVRGVPAVDISRTWSSTTAGVLYIAGPKAGSKRVVTIDQATADMLAARAVGLGRGGYLFRGARGGYWRYDRFVRGPWARAMTQALAAGVLAERITPHALRHAHGSWLLDAGEDLLTVSRRLGHSSIKTTADIYGHPTGDSGGRVASRVGDLLGTPPAPLTPAPVVRVVAA